MRNSLAAVVVTVLVALSTSASAQTPRKATPMSDAELDGVTAGTTTQLFVLRNPGNVKNGEGIFKTRGDSLQCINCFGLTSEDTMGIKIMTNPAKTKIHCISATTCF